MAAVRYIVDDVDSALEFYRTHLGFTVTLHNPDQFAALDGAGLTLYLSAPGAGSGGQAGGHPEPGGWNRFMFVTEDVDSLIERLRRAGVPFRGGLSDGGAGGAILLADPSGNLVELFEFKNEG